MFEFKFKVGDQVKRLNSRHGNFKPGDIGEVIAVSMDKITLKDDKYDHKHDVDNLELYIPRPEIINNYQIY